MSTDVVVFPLLIVLGWFSLGAVFPIIEYVVPPTSEDYSAAPLEIKIFFVIGGPVSFLVFILVCFLERWNPIGILWGRFTERKRIKKIERDEKRERFSTYSLSVRQKRKIKVQKQGWFR